MSTSASTDPQVPKIGGKKGKSKPAAPVSPYAHTLHLPSTDFPMRPDPTRRGQLNQLTTRDLYDWQSATLTSRPQFILHDGPPYANGDLHTGHALNKILKDTINRHALLTGHKVHYVPGWDCHGLPIELKALQSLPKDQRQIVHDPVAVRAKARELAKTTVEKQRADFESWAVMGDWAHAYRTLEPAYVLRQLKVFKEMVAKGLVFRQRKPVYYSPATRTALAEAELEHTEHTSQSVYVKFPVTSSLVELPPNVALLIWTTTPWTLPANQAAAVNKGMEYSVVKVDEGGEHWVIATPRLAQLVQDGVVPESATVVQTLTGSQLVGLTYSPPYAEEGHKYPVVAADYVTSEAGTGVVHTAPGHGMDDYITGMKHGLKILSPVDAAGKYDSQAPTHLRGLAVLTDGTRAVLSDLRTSGHLIHHHPFRHKYPYDWRAKTPVITCATPQWFARIDTIRDTALSAVADSVAMVPESGRNRLASYVADRSEWCISRQRAWGVPVPAMFHKETGEALMTPESIDHVLAVLEREGEGADAWWRLDDAEFVPPSVPEAERGMWVKGKDTVDVWFDSGTSWSMLPGEGVADVYLEGSDQHRGWFQSSLLTSVATRGKAPFKKVITHGFVVDESRQKMSKSIGNVVLPSTIVHGGPDKKKNPPCGVDGLRLWIGMSEYSRGDITLGPTVLANAADLARKLRNTCRFLLANLHGYTPVAMPVDQLEPLDRYALGQVAEMVGACEAAYKEHQFAKVVKQLAVFANVTLSAVYFEAIKDRLYAEPHGSPSRVAAQYTLHQILTYYVQCFAPIVPLLTEEVFDHARHLLSDPSASSPTLASYFAHQTWQPTPSEWSNADLARDMSGCLAVRDTANQVLEQLRRDKLIRTNLESDLVLVPKTADAHAFLTRYASTIQALAVVSRVRVSEVTPAVVSQDGKEGGVARLTMEENEVVGKGKVQIVASRAAGHKCPRCWNFWAEKEEEVCGRCVQALR